MRQFIITEELVMYILKYLYNKPYNEVNDIIIKLQQELVLYKEESKEQPQLLTDDLKK